MGFLLFSMPVHGTPGDPDLIWNTFLGGTVYRDGQHVGGREFLGGIALDSDGSIYTAGRCYSGIFVSKFDSTGAPVWDKIFPNLYNSGAGITVGQDGYVYVTGQSMGTWGSPVRGHSGDSDGFIVKLDTSGNVIWNTFLGGTRTDDAYRLAVDAAGFVYVIGSSQGTWGSPIRPITGAINYIADVFVAKLTSSGNLVWHTFLGGAEVDKPYGIALDMEGNIYVTGESDGSWGTPRRPYTQYTDVFAAKLDNNGNLIWNTFLGGTGGDMISAIAVDKSANVYVTGSSSATWGSPIGEYLGDGMNGMDGFIARLDAAGALLWNTFLGATTTFNVPLDITTGPDGEVYVTGYSGATWGSPLTPYVPGVQSHSDGWIAKVSPAGSLIWNTFLGASGHNDATAIAADPHGNVYVGGYGLGTWGSPIMPFFAGHDGYGSFIAVFGTALILTTEGTGEGTGTISASGLTCSGTTCTGKYPSNARVTLSATPDSSSTFEGWSGGGCSGTGTCTVAMTADTTVSARFARPVYTVNASVAGGHGQVSPATQGVTRGSSASITFTPDAGYHVATLSDNGTSTAATAKQVSRKKQSAGPVAGSVKRAIANPYVISNVTTNHTLVATFAVDTFTLTATRTGTGSGTITASGLTCSGATCTGSYPANTQVTLTAIPDSASTFVGWSGGGCSGTGTTCTVNVTAHTSMSASFAKITHTVNATVSGGQGQVSPATQSVPHGSSASITFTPDAGYRVSQVSDDLAGRPGQKSAPLRRIIKGSGASYIIQDVTANHDVAVTFSPITFTLTVNKTGDGTGAISATDLACTGNTCTGTYPANARVTLTATPDSASTFAGWSGGGCSGTNTCTITVTANTVLAAPFDTSCEYRALPAKIQFAPRGGSYNVTVTAKGSRSCPSPEIATGGTGVSAVLSSWKNSRGIVRVTMKQAEISTDRSAGTLQVKDQSIDIMQKGMPCAIEAFRPAGHTASPSGENHTFDIVVSARDCGWTAAANKEWIAVGSTSGIGNGNVTYTVPANGTKRSRTGKVTVSLSNDKQRVHTVTQRGR
jgi:hypothetical protein